MSAVARLFVRRYLDGHPLAHDAEVVVSEFFSNAIRYSRSPNGGIVRVCVIKLERSIRIEVTDPGGGATVPGEKRPSPGDEHGRGLGIVRAMATAWGHEGLGDVYVTSWAQLDDPGARLRSLPEIGPGWCPSPSAPLGDLPLTAMGPPSPGGLEREGMGGLPLREP
ncbi:ATP-binding protein [Herbidospora yilanensis]|uniref:ATP-binding protein n=1 Tax=Herbidospora yilanensis TaxID=354426 RepID=UPI000A017456|nr:ATP-binding protein [Herbidospora yilanensis]